MRIEASQELPSIFALIWQRKRIFWTVFGGVFALGIAYMLLAPAVWEARATILFPVRTPSILGAGSFDQASLAATLTGGPTPLKVYGGMLESERALGFVASESGLTRRQVSDMRTLRDQAMESSITISARDKDASLAKKVVALHLQALKSINDTVSRPMADDDSAVLEKKLSEQQRKLAQAEQKLLAFQKSAVTAPMVAQSGTGKDSSVVPGGSKWSQLLRDLELDHRRVDGAVKSVQGRIESIAKGGGKLPAALPPVQKWRDRLTELQYDLKIQELTLASEAPELVKLRKSIAITERQLRSELEKYSAATNAGMVESDEGFTALITQRVALEAQIAAVRKLAALAPDETVELARLTREIATQSAILQQIQAQYELASMQADRDPNRWQVLDEPFVDDKPVNKSLTKNGALSLIAALAMGAFAALVWPRKRAEGRGSRLESEELEKAA